MQREDINTIEQTNKLTIFKAIQAIAYLSLPNILSFVLANINDTISLLFIGQLNNPTFISAVGLGIIISNYMCFQPLASLSIALDTLVSQSYGKKDYAMCGLYLNRILIMLIIFAIPFLAFLLYIGQILNSIGFDPTLAFLIGNYTSYAGIFVLFGAIFYVLNRFLNAQKIVYPQMVITSITSLLHIFWCWVFVIYYDYETLGPIMANTATYSLNLISIIFYIFYSGCCKDTLVKPDFKKIFTNLKDFLKITLAGSAMAILEWWTGSVLMLLTGVLDNFSSSTNQILFNLNYFFYMVPNGVGSAATALVGSCLGKRQVNDAKLYALVAYCFNLSVVGSLTVTIILSRSYVIALYTNVKEVREMFGHVIFFSLAGYFADCSQALLSRILVAQGKQIYATITNLVIYLGFLWPIGFSLILYYRSGLIQLWCCYGGCAATVALNFSLILIFEDWDTISEEAYARTEREKYLSQIKM